MSFFSTLVLQLKGDLLVRLSGGVSLDNLVKPCSHSESGTSNLSFDDWAGFLEVIATKLLSHNGFGAFRKHYRYVSIVVMSCLDYQLIYVEYGK